MKSLRFLPLLFLFVLAPAVLAENVDLRVSLWMPPTAVFHTHQADPVGGGSYGYAMGDGILTLTNTGSAPVQGVTFQLDSQLILIGDEASRQRISCNWKTCSVPELAPGSLNLAVSADWSNAARGTVETTSVSASSTRFTDPDLTNNSASATTTIVYQSDVTFEALSVTSPAAPGKTSAITAFYSNHGPSETTDLSITISIPPGARYEGYYARPWFHCTEPPLGGQGDLVCRAPSIGLITNDSVEALIGLDPSLAPGTVLTLNGTLTSSSALQSPLTASGSLTVIPPTSADAVVSVAAAADKPAVAAGEMTAETYTISNAGPHDAYIVALDVRLPAGSVPSAATWTFNSCSGTTMMHCTAPAMAAGTTMSLTVPVQTHATGTFTSTAVVTWQNGGTAAASANLVVVDPTPPRRRATKH